MATNTDSIRDQMAERKGRRVSFCSLNGRKKMETLQGIIVDVYPSLFTLYVESRNATLSFSYVDVLTGEIKMDVLGEENP